MTPLHTHIDIERLSSQIGNRSDLLSRLADAFIRQLDRSRALDSDLPPRYRKFDDTGIMWRLETPGTA